MNKDDLIRIYLNKIEIVKELKAEGNYKDVEYYADAKMEAYIEIIEYLKQLNP